MATFDGDTLTTTSLLPGFDSGDQLDGDGNANKVHSTQHNYLRDFAVSVHTRIGTGSAKIPRTATFVVAASDASDAMKAQADYLCDGTADDVQIQAAIDALSATYGGVVQLSEGTFAISASIRLKTGTVLHGLGRSRFNPDTGTILSAASGLNDAVIKLDSANVKHVEIADLVIDGNEANQTSGDGILLDRTGTGLTNAPRDLLQNVQIFDAKGVGIKIVQPSGAGGGAADLIGCMVSGCGGVGYEISGFDVFASHCIALLNTGSGWFFTNNSGATQLSNCKGDSNGGIGFHISGDGNIKLYAVEARTNQSDGIRVNQDGCLINGAFLINNGTAGTPRSGLDITGNCQRLVATGLQIRDDNGDGRMDYGVQIASGADDILLDGMVSGYSTGALDNGTSGTVTNRLVDADA